MVEVTKIEANELSNTRAREEAIARGEPVVEALSLPSAVDNSTQIYFPPIRSQGGQGSCTCWAACYYYNTYTQARDEDFRVSDGNDANISSPAFMYPLINGGSDHGASTSYAVARLNDIGCCSWLTKPYSDSDYTTWPSEAAWVEALNWRTQTGHNINGSTPTGLNAIKQHLANGNVAATRFTVYDNWYDYPNDAVGINNRVYYAHDGAVAGGHAVTLVGYNDNRSYVDHRDGLTHYGAFLLANSWGDGWGWYNSTGHGTKGFFWVAYQMFLDWDFGPYAYYNDDRPEYRPKLYAVTGINHTERARVAYTGGIGSTSSPEFNGPEPIGYDGGTTLEITDEKRVAVDLTDGEGLISPGVPKDLFVELTVSSAAASNGTITSATFFHDPEGDGVFKVYWSPDPIVTVAPDNYDFATVQAEVAPREIHVDDSNTTGPWDGSSDNPYMTIREGLDAATVLGDSVVVAPGTYTGPDNRGLGLTEKQVPMKSASGAASTIIDCEGSARAFYLYSIGDPGVLIDGFTIRNGHAALNGGGIYCEESTLALRNCVMEDCSSNQSGGGLSCESNSSAILTNCILTGNSSGDKGGGVFCSLSEVEISDCTLTDNFAANFGGGVMISWGGMGTITDSILWGNSAGDGDEIALKHTNNPSTATVSYCDVEGGESSAHVMFGCVLDWGDGNIDIDPLFTTGPVGDYYLSQTTAGQGSDSPCVDAGSDAAAHLDLDTRSTRTDEFFDMGTVDMGYHYPAIPDLFITSIEVTAEGVIITWNSQPGVSYTVQHSTNLVDWTDVPVGETDTWTDESPVTEKRVYRVLGQ
jgi:hypothetical protein